VENEQEQEQEQEQEPEQVAERPEYIPEKFWNTETNEVRLEDMAKSYSTAEKAVSGRITQLAEDRKADIDAEAREALKVEMNEEVTAARLADRPETPDAYELGEVPEVFDKDHINDGTLATWWRGFAHDQGLSQDKFKEGMDAYLDYIGAELPDPVKEMASLGDNGQVRADAVEMWSARFFKDATELAEIQAMGSTAAGVRALERVMEATKGTRPSTEGEDNGEVDGKVSVEKAKEMMADPRYHDAARRDPEWVKRVNEAFG
tara:strand:- start:1152 stop:1937 length:786 start_codon:yes stop_codon:yes gene_type:complete